MVRAVDEVIQDQSFLAAMDPGELFLDSVDGPADLEERIGLSGLVSFPETLGAFFQVAVLLLDDQTFP